MCSVYICMHVFMYARMHAYQQCLEAHQHLVYFPSVCVACIYVCMYLCMHVCMHINTALKPISSFVIPSLEVQPIHTYIHPCKYLMRLVLRSSFESILRTMGGIYMHTYIHANTSCVSFFARALKAYFELWEA